MNQSYNGIVLFKDSLLSVYDEKTKNQTSLSINIFNKRNKYGRYKSSYRGIYNTFQVSAIKPPSYMYKVILHNDLSFICGCGSKNMVYREGGNELLPIEIIYKKFLENRKDLIYLPFLTKDDSYKGVDLTYSLIQDIILINNFNNIAYQILFNEEAKSVLMKLDNGIVIKGDKG
jgi:hypothetical protein